MPTPIDPASGPFKEPLSVYSVRDGRLTGNLYTSVAGQFTISLLPKGDSHWIGESTNEEVTAAWKHGVPVFPRGVSALVAYFPDLPDEEKARLENALSGIKHVRFRTLNGDPDHVYGVFLPLSRRMTPDDFWPTIVALQNAFPAAGSNDGAGCPQPACVGLELYQRDGKAEFHDGTVLNVEALIQRGLEILKKKKKKP